MFNAFRATISLTHLRKATISIGKISQVIDKFVRYNILNPIILTLCLVGPLKNLFDMIGRQW